MRPLLPAVLLWSICLLPLPVPAESPADVLGPVQPASRSLTRGTPRRIVDFIEWVFKAPLTLQQRARLGELVVSEHKHGKHHRHVPVSQALRFVDPQALDQLLERLVPEASERAFVARCLVDEGPLHHRGANYLLASLAARVLALVPGVDENDRSFRTNSGSPSKPRPEEEATALFFLAVASSTRGTSSGASRCCPTRRKRGPAWPGSSTAWATRTPASAGSPTSTPVREPAPCWPCGSPKRAGRPGSTS